MSNLFFNNYGSFGEQTLVENLAIEAINIHGHDVYYCPRSINKLDELYGEDSLSSYNKAYDTTVYVKSFDSYEGDGTFLSKFNIEVRDQITFTIARRVFKNEIGDIEDIARPREGDLVFSTIMKRLFIVKFINNTSVFYQMGALQTWDMVCEVFEYSNEIIDTGVEEIDNIQTTFSFAGVNGASVSNTAFSTALQDVFETNTEIQDGTAGLLDWTDVDPFSDGVL